MLASKMQLRHDFDQYSMSESGEIDKSVAEVTGEQDPR